MDPSARTSVTLLAQLGAATADAPAWSDFVDRYGPQLSVWCRHWGLQPADADDVRQDVLMRVARQMQAFRYDPSKSFRGWLKTVARAAWSDWLSAGRRAAAGSGDTAARAALESVAARDDLADRLAAEFDRELLDAATAVVRGRVAPETWEAFRLTAVDGLSGAEAAARLGTRASAVYVNRGRVQKMLQDEVRRLGGEEAAADAGAGP